MWMIFALCWVSVSLLVKKREYLIVWPPPHTNFGHLVWKASGRYEWKLRFPNYEKEEQKWQRSWHCQNCQQLFEQGQVWHQLQLPVASLSMMQPDPVVSRVEKLAALQLLLPQSPPTASAHTAFASAGAPFLWCDIFFSASWFRFLAKVPVCDRYS